jgi:poly(A) polymerase
MELTVSAFPANAVEGDPGAADITSTLGARDITIHAFAVLVGGDLVDPFGGVQHLREKTLHPVEAPRVVFRERPEMLLRMARYIAEYGYDVLPDTTRFATRDAANILSVSRDIWSEEMNNLLLGPYVNKGLEWLLSTGILRFLLPEVVLLVDFHRSCAVHHKDCWDHTVQVTHKANPDLCTRWAALCHDVGKIWTRSVDRNRQVHFYRHEEFGSVLFEGIAARFQMEPDLADRVATVIRLHGRVNLYESNWTDSAIRRLVRDSGKYLDDLIRFSKADFTSKRPERIATIRRQLDELQVRIASIHEKASQRSPLPKGLGTVLISELDLPPGPNLGHLRRGLEFLCLSGEIESEQDPAYYVEQTRTMGVDTIIEIDKKQREQKSS